MSTQRQRLGQARLKLMALYPQLDKIRREMGDTLAEAANGPPDGASDGSVPTHKHKEYRAIEKHLGGVLVSMLFDQDWAARVLPTPVARVSEADEYCENCAYNLACEAHPLGDGGTIPF